MLVPESMLTCCSRVSVSEHQAEGSASQRKTPQNHTPRSKSPFLPPDCGFKSGLKCIPCIREAKGYIFQLGTVRATAKCGFAPHTACWAFQAFHSSCFMNYSRNPFCTQIISLVSVLLIIKTNLMLFSVRYCIYYYTIFFYI